MLALASALLVAGCTAPGGAQGRPTGNPPTTTAPTTATQPAEPLVYAAVGASETVGVGADDPQREAWPQVLHDTSLPSSTLVNVGASGATVRGALSGQLPQALAAEPDVVTVWLAVNDLVAGVPADLYERELGRLVGALSGDGEVEVLVGNVPDLWRLPVYRACLPGSGVTEVPCLLPSVPSVNQVRVLVGDFNAAIDRVVSSQGARLVDLSGRRQLAGLTAGDGFHPSTAGHREVAAAFQRVLERYPPG